MFLKKKGSVLASPMEAVNALPGGDITSLEDVVIDAAQGHYQAAQHLTRLLIEENPQAIRAVVWYPGPQMLVHLLDWLALGMWDGKRLAFPADIHEPQARTKIRVLFLPGPGWAGKYGHLVLGTGLHDPRALVRAKAAQVLGLFGEPSVAGELERALRDPERIVRLQAAKALRRLHLRQTLPALLEALTTHDETLASEIHLALLQLGPAALPLLLKGAQHPDAWVRWHVFRVLGQLHDVRGELALTEGLADSDHAAAWMAARALSSPSKQAIISILYSLVRVPSTPWLCETAAYVLRRQEYPQMKSALEPVLHSLRRVDYRIAVPQAAGQALECLWTSNPHIRESKTTPAD